MEVLLLGIFFWLILKLVGKRQQLTKAKRAYLTMVDDAAMGLADEQFAYEAGVESLPDLEGDGTFSFEVSLTRADNDDLESIYTYLDLKGLKRESLATVLKSERVGSASQVAVELSQAPLGIVGGESGQVLSSLRGNVGGQARCSGRLNRDKKGVFRYFLDIKAEAGGQGDATT